MRSFFCVKIHIDTWEGVSGVKKIFLVILIVLFATLLLPLAVVYLMGTDSEISPKVVSVYLSDEDVIRDMDINEYLKCVVAAEMPAEFEKEALKAQAVAARTYLYSHINENDKGSVSQAHKGAIICTNYEHCQSYLSEEECKKRWGEDGDKNWDKISSSVDETTGEVIEYNGEIISAVFHSTSSGRTESSADVWGKDVPYLQSVESVGDEQSPKFYSEQCISVDEFKSVVEESLSDVPWEGGIVSDIKRSEAGGVISLNIGGVEVSGSKLRSMFSLRSTNVEFSQDDNNIKMVVKGYGHGVGMSQYGADYLAKQGMNYRDILKTYYTGVEICNVK